MQLLCRGIHARLERGEFLARIVRGERVALDVHLLLLAQAAAQPVLQLLDARAFDHRLLVRVGDLATEAFPACLPGLRGMPCLVECLGGLRLRRTQCDERGFQLRDRGLERIDLMLVASEQRSRLGALGLGLLEVGALACTQLAGVLDRLLTARGIRADLVVAALHLVELLAALRVRLASMLDSRLAGPQRGQCGLQRGFLVARSGLARLRLAIQVAQPQR